MQLHKDTPEKQSWEGEQTHLGARHSTLDTFADFVVVPSRERQSMSTPGQPTSYQSLSASALLMKFKILSWDLSGTLLGVQNVSGGLSVTFRLCRCRSRRLFTFAHGTRRSRQSWF